jgi:DNA (cytosine-5)-methyltransferase 1
MIGSLFSGIGGIELGLESLGLGPTVWQAESDPYARAVLAKHWPAVRCYHGVKEIDEQAERPEIICGGFPCTDISNAGKRAGIDGERSGLWREFARIVRILRPRYVFIENVAALLARGIDRVLGDLAACGYDAQWDVFRASDVGAPHRRERLFILANANGAGRGWAGPAQPARRVGENESARTVEAMADTAQFSEREPADKDVVESRTRRTRDELGDDGGRFVADSGCVGRRARWTEPAHREQGRSWIVDGGHCFPPGPDRIAEWSGAEPAVRRGHDGIPGRVDRLRCLGNAVVPQVAALAWQTLIDRAAKPEGTPITKETK